MPFRNNFKFPIEGILYMYSVFLPTWKTSANPTF